MPSDETSVLPEFAMLTMLIRLVVMLRNNSSRASMHRFDQQDLDESSQLDAISAISAILVQEHEVIASYYQTKGDDSRTVKLQLTIASIEDQPDDERLTLPSIAGDVGPLDDELYNVIPGPHSTGPIRDSSSPLEVGGASDGSRSDDHLENTHNLRIVRLGQEHWSKIKAHDFSQIKRMPIPLEDHAATLFAYLDDFTHDPSQRQENSFQFFNYLLSVSWRKMYSRITSWQGLGLIYNLCHLGDYISARHINWEGHKFPAPESRYDHALASFLDKNDEIVQAVQMLHPIEDETTQQSLKLLLSAARAKEYLYTEKTAAGFHYLLSATFVSFGWSLYTYNKEQIGTLRRFMAMFTMLLQHILSSSAFEIHMLIYTCRGRLLWELKPKFEKRHLYMQEAMTKHLVRNGTPERPVPSAPSKPFLPSAEPSYDDSEESLQLATITTLDDFMQWMRVFVGHFIAKQILEDEARKCQYSLGKLLILAVGRKKYEAPSWKSFEAIIEKAIKETKGCSLDSKQVTEVITHEVRDIQGSQLEFDAPKLVGQFRNIINARCKSFFTVGPHCEVVFAAFARFHNEAIQDKDSVEKQDLLQACQILDASHISRSKLCCPVCWDLLCILRDNRNKPLTVRGCHSIIYPVVLPEWLPKTICETMFKIYQGHLCNELETLMRNRSKGY